MTTRSALDQRGRYLTPLVRARARRAGLDPRTLEGRGAGGRVTPADVEQAALGQAAPVLPSSVRRMGQVSVEVDVTRALARLGAEHEVRVALVDLVAGSLRRHRELAPEVEDLVVVVDAAREPHAVTVGRYSDLSASGVDRALRERGTAREADSFCVELCDRAPGAPTHLVPDLPAGQAASLGAGAVTRRVVVVVDADGLEGMAVRSIVSLCVSYDRDRIGTPEVAGFLADLVLHAEQA